VPGPSGLRYVLRPPRQLATNVITAALRDEQHGGFYV
jgi:hypothetical protein